MDLNVVIVSDHAYVSGGSAQVALASAKELARRNIHVTLFSAAGPPEPEVVEAGARVVCLGGKPYNRGSPLGRALFAGLWDRGAARAFRSLLRDMPHGKTVVHVHSFVDALSASVPDVALRSGHPVAFTLHDYNFACPYGGFYDYRRERICPFMGLSAACWKTNCSTSPYPKKLWRNARLWLQRRRLDLAGATFVFVSEFSRRILEGELPLRANRVEVRNPIDLERLPPVSPSDNEEYAFLGRLSPEKGAHLFAEAAARAGVPAVFVGDGPIRERVAALCPSAKFTGWLSKAEAHERLRYCRAVVFPSLWYEAAPLAVQEAMALGLPAIVSDACAGRDAVRDGDTGLLFRKGDLPDLVAKITMLSDDTVADRVGKAAFEAFWSDPPTLESHGEALLRLYENMLGGRA